ncbi:MAG TPA: dTMP kinase [Bryobacteraceae bacterium]|jgi:dTMP kinase|nr:dTMP kinase [Bryobacteraceae bacterium]
MLPNRYKGKLIVVEGIEGSGKRTQISLLAQWLRAQGYAVAFRKWNSSPPVQETIERGIANGSFTPTTFSLIQATDFADRMESYILPLIKAGALVCADGYAYTAFARDVARGAGRQWVRSLYSYALRPSLTLYVRVPLEVAISRLSGNLDESSREVQSRMMDEYEAMAAEMEFHVVDGTLPIEDQQRRIRETVVDCLGEVLRTRVLRSTPRGSQRGGNGISPAAAVL